MVTITLEIEDSFIRDTIEDDFDKGSNSSELLIALMNKIAFLELMRNSNKKDIMLFLNSNAISDEHIDKFRALVSQAYMLCRVSEEN